ncbi:MAG: carboxypeptidase-like regulatory domain-containing protein, partial [Endomicrobiia bacterium]
MKKVLSIVFWISLILCFNQVFSQTGTVKGVVTDSNGDPLFGANVVVKNTSLGVISGINGEFVLGNIPVGERIIEISFVGMKKQEHKLLIEANKTITLNVKLEDDAVVLEDVVVIGYGRRQKRDVTGAISSISSDDLGDAVL